MRLRHVAVFAKKAGGSPQEPQEPPAPSQEDDEDLFFGGDGVRQWMALEEETRSVIQLSAGFFLLPALLSWALRATVIDPLLFLLQVRLHDCARLRALRSHNPSLFLGLFGWPPQPNYRDLNLTQRQWNEVTMEVEVLERRLRYDARMGHAPPLSDTQLEERLVEEGRRLEDAQRLHCRESVGNTLSDGLGTVLLFTGFWLNRGRLRALRTGLAARFLALEVSTQAFILLLAADVTVGYHSSDGWVTFVEVLVSRYNVDGSEGADNAIRLFVAVVPVVIDVTFKWWCYKYLRKLSPGTQIILSEIERH